MTQERLADLLGVTFQQVQKYERGVNRIAASRLFDISAALDMDIGQFFVGFSPRRRMEGPSSPSPNNTIADALATRDGTRLITLFASVSNTSVRRRIVQLVEALAKSDM